VVSRHHLPHLIPYSLDDTGALMTEDRRELRRQLSVSTREVGVADTHADDSNEHVGTMKLGELDILDDKRAAQAVSDCG
jgi:hypothetical protein